MKKLIALLSSITMLAVAGMPANAEGYANGDVDMDGIVTAHDAAVISRYVNANDISLSGEQLALADYNGDGIVDETDAEAITSVSDTLLGDMDDNGNLDLIDVNLIIRQCAPYKTEPAEADKLARADVDADGVITVNDYALLAQYYYLTGASFTIDFGCSYFNWDADNMLNEGRAPLLTSYSILKPMNFFGDVNVDNCLNELDAEIISEYLETGEASDKIRIFEADINIDGVIDQNDIDMILASPHEYRSSDVNEDCYVDLNDAADVLSFYARKGASLTTSGTIFQQADDSVYDANKDGVVDLSDAADIVAEYAMDGAGILS